VDKNKEKYAELLKFNEKLDKIEFIELSRNYPYKITEDILEQSNTELKAIAKDIETIKSTLSELVKMTLKVIFDMIDTKIELINEQNKMISHIYGLLSNLSEKDIRTRFASNKKGFSNEDNISKNSKSNKNTNNMTTNPNETGNDESKTKISDISDNIEYIYRDIIIKAIRDAYKVAPDSEDTQMTIEAKNKLDRERDEYLTERIEHVKKLQKRNEMSKEIGSEDINFKEVKSFGYAKQENENKSFFSWGI
jgi:hypothetical protein